MARYRLWPGLALLAAAASWAVGGTGSVEPAAQYVLHVKAVIDGSSYLYLTGDEVSWHHGMLKEPGQELRVPGDGPWPTVINGAEWFPQWQGSVSNTYPLPFKLPSDLSGATVTVAKLNVRGNIETGVRKQDVIVHLDDTKIDGADWYEFELRIRVPGAGAVPQPGAAAPAPQGSATGPTAPQPPGARTSVAAAQKDAAATAPQQPPAATGSQDYIAAQADAEAKALAAQRLAAEGAQLNAAAQTLAQAQAVRNRVFQEASALEAQLQQGEPAYQKAVREEADIRKMGWLGGDTLYFEPGPYAQFITATNLRQQLEAQRNRLMDALTQKRGELVQADGLLQVAQRNYGDLRGRYEKAFADIYNTEYPKRVRDLEALRDKKVAEFDARRKALLKDDLIPGQYTWTESGEDVGKFAFAPDHTVKSLTAKDKPAGQWQVNDEGLRVTQGGEEWSFLPGAPNAFIGTCLGPDPKARGRKALLQRAAAAEGAPGAPAGSPAAKAAPAADQGNAP